MIGELKMRFVRQEQIFFKKYKSDKSRKSFIKIAKKSKFTERGGKMRRVMIGFLLVVFTVSMVFIGVGCKEPETVT
ncbi:MAG TPA: hypothetical protein DCP02_05240, partial [Actinobacteria bacterium]|nr:hypothetical protein [Actinomycetota bacterium]